MNTTDLTSDRLVLLGYFPQPVVRLDGYLPSGCDEVRSVSQCLNPESWRDWNWIEHWIHNELGFFDSIDDAESVAPKNIDTGYHIVAYRLLPLEFVEGQSRAMELPPLSVEPMAPDFESLGFDVVSKSHSDFFECSPLSCNGMCGMIPVNRYCLLRELSTAVDMAARFSIEQPEPGRYYVIEVLRRHGAHTV